MKERVTQRFLKYVAVDTQSDEASDTFPSTEKQKVLAKMLVEELRRMGAGLPEVRQGHACGPHRKGWQKSSRLQKMRRRVLRKGVEKNGKITGNLRQGNCSRSDEEIQLQKRDANPEAG